MNIVSFTIRLKNRLISGWADFYYCIFQKLFYLISFNSNGNKFVCKGKVRHSHILVAGSGNVVTIGSNTLLNKVDISISGLNNKLIIHDSVSFLEGGRVRIEDSGNIIEIDEKTNLINCFFSVADSNTKLIVGRECLFSAGVIIRTSDAHSIVNSFGKRINSGGDVIIGNHVWIGYGVTVLKGTTIGDNCIVGTESLVSGLHLDNNTVAVGNPCNIVKREVNWTNCRLEI